MTALYFLFALQVLDLISTVVAFQKPGLEEANPVLAWLFRVFGVLPTLLVAKAGFIAFTYYAQAQIPIQLIYLASAMYVYVVVNNFQLIRGK